MLIHIFGAAVVLSLVVIFPTGICLQIRKIYHQKLLEDEDEMIKYSIFYADFKVNLQYHGLLKYFFFCQHFFQDTALAMIEVFFIPYGQKVVTGFTVGMTACYMVVVVVARPFSEWQGMALDLCQEVIVIFCLASQIF